MQIALANEVETHAEAFCSRADASQRGLRRLLHHVTEFAGKRHAATTFNKRRFDLKHFAADFCPGESGCESDFTLARDALLSELDRTEHLANSFRIDDDCRRVLLCLFRDKLARELAAT